MTHAPPPAKNRKRSYIVQDRPRTRAICSQNIHTMAQVVPIKPLESAETVMVPVYSRSGACRVSCAMALDMACCCLCCGCCGCCGTVRPFVARARNDEDVGDYSGEAFIACGCECIPNALSCCCCCGTFCKDKFAIMTPLTIEVPASQAMAR